jgi:hypothetical protein
VIRTEDRTRQERSVEDAVGWTVSGVLGRADVGVGRRSEARPTNSASSFPSVGNKPMGTPSRSRFRSASAPLPTRVSSPNKYTLRSDAPGFIAHTSPGPFSCRAPGEKLALAKTKPII